MRHNIVSPAAALVGVALSIAVACKSTTSGGNTCDTLGTSHVTINATDGNQFSPSGVTVNGGQVICWQNLGMATHSITADNPKDSIDITLPPSFVYTTSFAAPKDFAYHCRFHGERATVTVR